MTLSAWYRNAAVGLVTLAVTLAAVPAVMADPILGSLYYTTFTDVSQGGRPFQVWRVDYNYTGNGTAGNGAFNLSNNTGIANTNGADGIVFLPNGNLAVGGQSTGLVHEVTLAGAILGSTAANAGSGGAYHLNLDPSGGTLYASGIPGDVGALAVAGGSPSLTTPGVNHNVVGSVPNLTSMAFVPNYGWYYTSSGSGGVGSFGTVAGVGGAGSYTTTQLFANVPAAHGLSYDPFTGNLILMGDDQISQYNPATNQFVSTRAFANMNFDQGTVDGRGHAFVASNTGHLLFVDYSNTGLIGSLSNFSALPFLNTNLDDVAPLVGPGANPVPEPATLLLLGTGLGALAARRRKRR